MASPRRRSFPLRLLLLIITVSLSVLLLLRRSSNPAPLLPTAATGPATDPRRFSLLIKLLAYDRPAPLRRCLRSLAAADYAGDRVALHVLLDHRPPNSSATLLAASHEILAAVDAFHWPHGEKRVHYRAANAGLQAQWIEAWWPGSDDEFAFVVEDDLEVSPLYYGFLKRVVMRYSPSKSQESHASTRRRLIVGGGERAGIGGIREGKGEEGGWRVDVCCVQWGGQFRESHWDVKKIVHSICPNSP